MTTEQHVETPTDPPQAGGMDLTTIDYVLAVLTFPLLAFALMFATTGMTNMLERPASRRRFGLVLLVTEVLFVAGIIAVVTR